MGDSTIGSMCTPWFISLIVWDGNSVICEKHMIWHENTTEHWNVQVTQPMSGTAYVCSGILQLACHFLLDLSMFFLDLLGDIYFLNRMIIGFFLVASWLDAPPPPPQTCTRTHTHVPGRLILAKQSLDVRLILSLIKRTIHA